MEGRDEPLAPLDRMADLILEDPVITVAELARRLGYAEDKTIYYWIAKANFSGLRSFKRAVLKGRYPAGRAREGTAAACIRLALASGFEADARPRWSGESVVLPAGTGRPEFAWRYKGAPAGPVSPGDLLVLGPPQPSPYPLHLARTRGRIALRLALPERGQPLVDPVTYQADPQARTVYVVLQLWRRFDDRPVPDPVLQD
ncbi:conserved protein of unknown function [Candidatus Hydrogenisulfobacillus filiaventi]|uniref:Uncharacterized protein n=1 Tax=Candidatus Hydrogenisulfobacillus filiaventi TaxID=2707344 RepID=A0A6F8ZHN1_9FIRM|nr:conserved protein of unknown function [Candidatus Hydrogenisulfobacillus filiaventi]